MLNERPSILLATSWRYTRRWMIWPSAIQSARIVELRFFGGLTLDEIAEVLGVAPVTVSRESTGESPGLAASRDDRGNDGMASRPVDDEAP